MKTIPWYKSNTLRGLAVALVLQVVTWLGVADQFAEPDVQRLVDHLLQFVEFASLLFAAWARSRQPTPPISDVAAAKMVQMAAGNVVRSSGLVGAFVLTMIVATMLAGAGCTTNPAIMR